MANEQAITSTTTNTTTNSNKNPLTALSTAAATMNNRTEQTPANNVFRSEDSLGSLEAVRKLMQSTGPDASSFMSKFFKSGDTSNTMFKSGESTSFLANLMKSGNGDRFTSNGLSDLFKSTAASAAAPTAPPAAASVPGASVTNMINNNIPDVFSSRDWASAYIPKHTEVDLQQVFQSGMSTASIQPPPATAKAKGKTDWNELYESKLTAHTLRPAVAPPPAARLTRATSGSATKNKNDDDNKDGDEDWKPEKRTPMFKPTLPTKKSKAASSPAKRGSPPKRSSPAKRGGSPSKRGKRSRPKLDPTDKTYVQPADLDVLSGRGGKINHHLGNTKYLEAKDSIQGRYMAASKLDKTAIAQELVDMVHVWGGRFLKKDDGAPENHWYELSNHVARKKASQTLREVNTAEVRAAKRAKYNGAL